MTTVNHALWGATIGRLVGMPYQGALMGALPDLIGIPALAYFRITKKIKTPEKLPRWAWYLYCIVHNWLFSLFLILVLSFIHPIWSFLGFAFFWHAIEDAFCHRTYASSFLYPLWKGKIKIQTHTASENWWIQVIDLLCMVGVNILISKYHVNFQ